MAWQRVDGEFLKHPPEWLYGPLWLSRQGVVFSGEYVWEQGRYPDKFTTQHGESVRALGGYWVMPLVIPEPPIIMNSCKFCGGLSVFDYSLDKFECTRCRD